MKRMFLLVCMFIMVFFVSVSGYAEETVNSAKKVYVCYLDGETTYVLEDVGMAEFNGIQCLKGRHANLSWVRNKVVYLPVNKISAVLEYDSVEQYISDIEDFSKKQIQ